MHRDLAQRLAAARAGHAFSALQFEAGTVHGTHQQAFPAAQELPRCPVEPASRMRAHVQPRAYCARGIAMHDQGFGIAIEHRLDFMQAVGRERVQPQQDRNLAVITL